MSKLATKPDSHNELSTEDLDSEGEFVWHCSGIAKEIQRTTRQTFHLLSTGKLPARKVGATWVASRPKLRAFLRGEA
jgi:hypothetical protein